MYTHGARTRGARTRGARVRSPRRKQKGQGCEHVDISQAAAVSRFRSLAFPFGYVLFQIPFFLFPFSLKWFVLGILCRVPFVLISRVWWPLLTFLHLYFGLCSRDVGTSFPTLCASNVHDVCIYILACPLRCDCHGLCHLRQAMPNFCRESKVTCCQIFALEIWHFAWMP